MRYDGKVLLLREFMNKCRTVICQASADEKKLFISIVRTSFLRVRGTFRRGAAISERIAPSMYLATTAKSPSNARIGTVEPSQVSSR